MARSKPTPHIVASREQAEGTMAEVAAIDRKLKALKIAMNEEIDAAKEKAARNSAPLGSSPEGAGKRAGGVRHAEPERLVPGRNEKP